MVIGFALGEMGFVAGSRVTGLLSTTLAVIGCVETVTLYFSTGAGVILTSTEGYWAAIWTGFAGGTTSFGASGMTGVATSFGASSYLGSFLMISKGTSLSEPKAASKSSKNTPSTFSSSLIGATAAKTGSTDSYLTTVSVVSCRTSGCLISFLIISSGTSLSEPNAASKSSKKGVSTISTSSSTGPRHGVGSSIYYSAYWFDRLELSMSKTTTWAYFALF